MKQLLVIVSLVFTNGCAVLSSHPFSDYNSNYLNAIILEKCEVYSVDMGEEKLLVYPTITAESNIYGTPYIKAKAPRVFRLVDGELVRVSCKDCNKK